MTPRGGGSWRIVAGRLPQGLHLAASGVVSGRPLQAGSASIEVLFRSAGYQLASQVVEIRISGPVPTSQARVATARRDAIQLTYPRAALLITSVLLRVAVWPPESVTRKSSLSRPARRGVPTTVPSARSRSPLGSGPDRSRHV